MMSEIVSHLKAIELLGISPPLKPQKSILTTTDKIVSLSADSPDEASKLEEDSSSSEKENGSMRKRKVVTFADFTNEPNIGMDDDFQEDEDENEEQEHPSPFLTARYKRSASLPHIELNQKLAKKIKKMEEDRLNILLEGTLKIFEEPSTVLFYEYEFNGGQLLQVLQGDITEERVDVIVNEANSNLQHSLGIAGAIAQKGGRDIQHQSDRWIRKYGPVPPGGVAVTEGGSLHCKRVVHAVGPLWRGGNSNEDHEYWDAIWHALEWAHKYKFKSMAIPLLGVGFLGFPKERCAYLLIDCISKFFMKYPKSKVHQIRLVNMEKETAEALKFEMVGKFTAGCDTSESERSDMSDLGEEGEEGEEEEEEEEEDTYEEEENNNEMQRERERMAMATATGPMQILPKDKRMLAWSRRQSIA